MGGLRTTVGVDGLNVTVGVGTGFSVTVGVGTGFSVTVGDGTGFRITVGTFGLGPDGAVCEGYVCGLPDGI